MPTVELTLNSGEAVLLPAVWATCHLCRGESSAHCGNCNALGKVKVLNITDCTIYQCRAYRAQQRESEERRIFNDNQEENQTNMTSDTDNTPITPRCNANERA
jgi:hypothetical protein